MTIISLAVPTGKEAVFEASAKKAGIALPSVGRFKDTPQGRLMAISQDQYFLIATDDGSAVPFGDAAYMSDQSDAWVALEIKGALVRLALERICPLDLHPKSFPTGSGVRTMMEHMGAFILALGDDEYLLLSARSSAKSFWHAVEVSVRNVS
jgi:sarcosine oxidase subunit gamma